MTLHTPRRRISPRTKRRYRAIREFFRRAIGSYSSQPEINTSIITDLKHNISLELQHNLSSKKSSSIHTDIYGEIKTGNVPSVERKDSGKTEVLYKPSASNYRKSESDCTSKTYKLNEARYQNQKKYDSKPKRRSKLDYTNEMHRYKLRSVSENFPSVYSTSSFHSLLETRMTHAEPGFSRRHERKPAIGESFVELPKHLRQNQTREYQKHKQEMFLRHNDEKHRRSRKSENCQRQLDQDFIADIIKRQYKPVKMFDRRVSDVSQFSAPVCRDQEFIIHEDIEEGTGLCSCCYDNRRPNTMRHEDLCEMRSICDTRLYSSKRHNNHRRKRGHGHTNVYNDSDLYDLVPVKEKSSPKSRRKFAEDNMTFNYREVPPSPRTLRPKLNLKSQYYNECEDYSINKKRLNRKCSPNRSRNQEEVTETFDSDVSSQMQQHRNSRYQKKLIRDQIPLRAQEQVTQNAGTMSSLQYPNYNDPNVTPNTSLNKTRETDISIDKTDKALCEIKDILQTFLHEIKKESSSQCDNSDTTNKIKDNSMGEMQQNSTKNNINIIPNSGYNFNTSVPLCSMPPPYMPAFPNPCCYPVVPVCPMNCMQNGYIVPSPSFTCTNCANPVLKDPIHTEKRCHDTNPQTNNNCNPETEDLIKEIYKYVTRSPKPQKTGIDKKEIENRKVETKILTSRSVGGSSKASKHDAKVGTPRKKCYSKSCEAIGSRMISDSYNKSAHATYSDTILEKLSLEATGTDTASETDFESTDVDKQNKSKFAKVFRTFGIFKKKKKDVIEELSESDSTIEVEIKSKPPPFRQDITNYSMHGQEYYQCPPVGPYQQSQNYQDYRPPYSPHSTFPHVNDIYNPHVPHYRPDHHPLHYHSTEQPGPARHNPIPSSFVPPHHSYDNHVHPNVPLCLKEIEVKSIGTQSERKTSFFGKMKTKIQPPLHTPNMEYQNTCSTQTAQAKPNLFNWKNLQNFEPKFKMNNAMNYSLKTQKDLTQGNANMKKALMKKLFYKRNPFSPRNLIVKTLLGKDKSSFGAPPRMYKPRMFF